MHCDVMKFHFFLRHSNRCQAEANMSKIVLIFLSLAVASFVFASENDVPDNKDSGN